MQTDWPLTLKNIFFPMFCHCCGCALLTEDNRFFCPTCWNAPERIERPFCPQCGKPQQNRIGFGPVENFPCPDCRRAKTPTYDRIFAAVDYTGAIADAVKLLKFYERRFIAGPLAELMIEFAEREMDTDVYDHIIPVPLHPIRFRSRGFNQAQLLADRLDPHIENARVNRYLQRIRPTLTQSRLKKPKEREMNVRGAFAVDQNIDLAASTVLLIDDVVTTGETVSDCARALKGAGATQVDVFAVARPTENATERALNAPSATQPENTRQSSAH